jgi:hypothetical protein
MPALRLLRHTRQLGGAKILNPYNFEAWGWLGWIAQRRIAPSAGLRPAPLNRRAMPTKTPDSAPSEIAPHPSRFVRLLDLLREASALEAAGSLWKPAHAAAALNMVLSTLRASDCPVEQYHARGHGARPIVRYDPAKVRAWRSCAERRASAPQKRPS